MSSHTFNNTIINRFDTDYYIDLPKTRNISTIFYLLSDLIEMDVSFGLGFLYINAWLLMSTVLLLAIY